MWWNMISGKYKDERRRGEESMRIEKAKGKRDERYMNEKGKTARKKTKTEPNKRGERNTGKKNYEGKKL